jgi:hypothetical protein
MFRTLKWIASLATLAVSAQPMSAQAVPAAEATSQDAPLVRRDLSGPRFGFTVFTGDVAQRRQSAGLEPVMTQFGWQLENSLIARDDGNEALLEWVFLVGGVEQSELNLSLSWLAGYRTAGGLEVGAGPAVSANKDNRRINTSMIVAMGATPPIGSIRIPLHVAVAMSSGGPRFTTLVGWIVD